MCGEVEKEVEKVSESENVKIKFHWMAVKLRILPIPQYMLERDFKSTYKHVKFNLPHNTTRVSICKSTYVWCPLTCTCTCMYTIT